MLQEPLPAELPPWSGWTTPKPSCWEPSQSQQMSAKGKISQRVANGKKKKGISQNSCKQPPEAHAKGTELSQSNVNNSIMEKSRSDGTHRSHIWTGMRNKAQMVRLEWWSAGWNRSEPKGSRAIPCPPPVSGCPVGHRDTVPGLAGSEQHPQHLLLELPQSPGYQAPPNNAWLNRPRAAEGWEEEREA